MRKKPLEKGQQVFTAGWDWLSNKNRIGVYRRFVLAAEPGRLELGESRRQESITYSGFNRDGETDHLYDTPEEAVDYFMDLEMELAQDKIKELIRAHFALKPKAMISALNMLRPIYRQTAVYGHFGRTEPEFTWERTDKADALHRDAGLR